MDKLLKPQTSSIQTELKQLHKEQNAEFLPKDENKNHSIETEPDTEEETVKFTAFETKENET